MTHPVPDETGPDIAHNVELGEWNREWLVKARDTPPPDKTDAEAADAVRRTGSARARAFEYLDAHVDDAVKFLQGLIRIPSVNPSEAYEGPLADYMAEQTERLGLTVLQREPAPSRKSNVARLEGSPGKTLLFISHLDTVPVGDESAWHHPPFEGQVADGHLYGRGAVDMKAGLAAAFLATQAILKTQGSLRGSLVLAATSDEERGGHWGLRRLVEDGFIRDIDCAVYTEGNSLDEVIIGARGRCSLSLTVHGKATHTARKQDGVNAIVNAARIIPALDALRFQDWKENQIVPGQPVASVNTIRGGFKENVVPDTCTFGIDLRFPPGTTPQGVLTEVNRVLDDLTYQYPYQGGLRTTLAVTSVARPYVQSPAEPVVRYLREACFPVLARRPIPRGMGATSDARWLVLDAGIPTIIYAAGNHTRHQPNERIDVDAYLQTIKIYTALALAFIA